MKTFDERRKRVMEHMDHIRRERRKTGVLAASACVLTGILCALLFVPYSTTPPSVRRYAGSEYYPVIQQLNVLTYQKPEYKNNYQALRAMFDSQRKSSHAYADTLWGESGVGMPMSPNEAPTIGAVSPPQPAPGEPSNDAIVDGAENDANYVETTDNQVEGVIEADIIKRSDRYIYYLRGNVLSVYSIEGMESKEVGWYSISVFHNAQTYESFEISYLTNTEMYLSPDCSTVILVQNGYGKGVNKCTALVTLDVSDPANISHKDTVFFVGNYVSSRMVDGNILLIYNYHIKKDQMDFSDPTTFIPQYGTPEHMQTIPGENIVCPKDATNTQYTVICKINADTLQVEGSSALLSYSNELYVSADTIYATHSYNVKNSENYNNEYKQIAMTEIAGISYAGDSLQILGTIALEGSVKDQYSMDQHEGILRVVTSTAVTGFRETFYGENASLTSGVTARNVNLYCIDLSDWQVEASVIGFAPAGEEATAVRFDGVYAYVCTADVITLTDPVYFFDLSDLSNITYTDTGIIDGYSTSLIQLGGGYLLGIGFDETRALKVEIYEETENGVESVCNFVRLCKFAEEYKSYFIDREKGLIGIATLSTNDPVNMRDEYLLLHFDGYELNLIKTLEYSGNRNNVRAVLIDGYFYLFSDKFTVVPLM